MQNPPVIVPSFVPSFLASARDYDHWDLHLPVKSRGSILPLATTCITLFSPPGTARGGLDHKAHSSPIPANRSISPETS